MRSERVVSALSDAILTLPPWVALLLVFALPALESSAFVGFVFPGEIAVILGGVLASRGNFPMALAAAVAIAGAFIGDSIGYGIGHRYGRRMLHGSIGRLPFVRTRLDAELGKAEAFLLRRGA